MGFQIVKLSIECNIVLIYWLIARAFEMETFYRIVEIQQQGETSLTATIPNDIAEQMELFKGQYMKIILNW